MHNDNYRRRKTWSSYKTDEGLAVLSGMYCDGELSLWSVCLRYVACILGSELGFKNLFDKLEEYIGDPEARFRYCCRVKRGIRDTSKPGAFGTDQAYLIGVVELLANRHEIDWFHLFSGLVSWEEGRKARYTNYRKWVLPPFLRYESQLKNFLMFLHQVEEHNSVSCMRRSKSSISFHRAII